MIYHLRLMGKDGFVSEREIEAVDTKPPQVWRTRQYPVLDTSAIPTGTLQAIDREFYLETCVYAHCKHIAFYMER